MTTFFTILATVTALLSPCEFEDSLNCTWYAEVQGNGAGLSFTNVGAESTFYHGDGSVLMFEDWRSK